MLLYFFIDSLLSTCPIKIETEKCIEVLQIEATSHRPLCEWQRQSRNSVRAKERDDGRFFLSLLRVPRMHARLERETA